MVPKIVFISGAGTGRTYDIVGELLVGRNPESQIRLPEEVISRRHAKVYMRGDDVIVEDLGSANGTFVRGEAISAPTKLEDGEVVSFGNISARIQYEGAASKGDMTKTLINISSDEESPSSSVLQQIDADRFALDEQTRSLENAEAVSILQKHLHSMNEITRSMAETLDLEDVLKKTLERLFEIFPQCEHGFVVLETEQEGESLQPVAVKTRKRDIGPHTFSISRTVVDLVVNNRKSVLCTDAASDDRFKGRQSIVDMNIRSMMATPILYQDRLLGFLQLDTSDMVRPFNNEALELLTTIGHQVGLFISNAQMHERLLMQSRLEQDLKFARSVQHNFLPQHFPEHPKFAFTAHYTPAYDVGGDFYDFVVHEDEENHEAPPRMVDVVIGDVTGKGVSAALMMARLMGDIRSLAMRSDTTAKLMGRINRVMHTSAVEGRFVTLLIMRLDTETGEITYTNAGHNPPAVRKKTGEVIFNDEEGEFPVGVVDEHEFRQEKIALEPGDIVMLTTDGVMEAMNSRGECYGNERLIAAMKNGPDTAGELQEAVLADIRKFVGNAKQSDDLTVVTFGMHPPGAGKATGEGEEKTKPPSENDDLSLINES